MAYLSQDKKQQLGQLCQQHHIALLWDEPMKQHTTFKIGGPAAALCIPENREQICVLSQFARQQNISLWYLGNGSNLLISDDGLDGIVVLLDNSFEGNIQVRGNILEAPAGKKLSALCQAACEAGLTGLEFAWGIPGSIGGAVYMNAGAYSGEMKDVLLWAEYLLPDGTIVRADKEELSLRYRHSRFMEKELEGACILRAAFELHPGDAKEIRAAMDEIIAKRKEKQPLEYPSGGSTFKRPEGAFAAKLIQDCGLKGLTVGGAQISEKHAGFVINRGGASCLDVMTLCKKIREQVEKETGFVLEMEIRRLP